MKKRLRFTTHIAASRQTVWNTMLALDSYRDWTAAFCEGSYFEGAWDKGSRIRFLSPQGGGMVAVIADNRPHEYLSIQHLGFINPEGLEDTTSDAVKDWVPAFENYTFTDVEHGTELVVDQDITEEYEAYMQEAWPRALARLKTLCEGAL